MNFNLDDIKNNDETLFFNAFKKIQNDHLSTSIILKKIVQGTKKFVFDNKLYDSKEEVLVKDEKIVEPKLFLIHDDNAINYTILCILAIKYESLTKYETFVNDYLKNIKELENKINFKQILSKVPKQVINVPAIIKPIIDLEKLELSFKLVISKEYNVNDLAKFSQLILDKQDGLYGKKTVFNHYIKNFAQSSQPLIEFLLNNLFNIKDDKKSIKLTPIMIDQLFLILKNKVFINELNQNYYCMLEEKNIEVYLRENKLTFNIDHQNIIKGYHYIYLVEDKVLHKINYPKKNELKAIYDKLVDDDISLDYIEEEFVSKMFYDIKGLINVEEEFTKKYPLIKIEIKSYFYLENDNINLDYKIFFNEQELKIKDINPIQFLDINETIIDNGYLNSTTLKYLSCIESLGFTYNDILKKFLLSDINDILDFTKLNLEKLSEYGEVFVSEEIRNKKSSTLSKFNIKVSYGVDLLSFKLVNTNLSTQDIKAIISSYKKKQKFVKLRDSILEIDEKVSEFVSIIEDFDLNVDKLLEEEQEKPYSYILKFLNEKNDLFLIDQEIDNIIYDLKNYKTADFKLPDSFKKVMRYYQVEAFLWMKTLMKYNFGGILADEMGLGKTLEVISVISSDEPLKPTIVVCPTSLIYNWQSEMLKWDKSLIVKPIIGPQSYRKEMIDHIKSDEKIIYITSYDTLKKDIALYNNVDFRMVIADEAQFIKNKQTLKSEAIKTLKSDIRFSLTGTPIENSLADLWSIFDFVMPGYLSSYNNFKDRYEKLIISEDKEILNQLILRVMPFVLRRTKKQVLKDLPDKHESVYKVKLNEEQQKLYDVHYLDTISDLETKNHISILTLITRLRQICVDPSLFLTDYDKGSSKIDLCIELISKYISLGHKILLFSQFPSVFEKLEKKLNELNINNFTLTGKTRSDQRMSMVNKFNEDENIKVFFISLKAGGTGLNLTSASVVIHLDPWWNTSVENQASDRAHRIGQTKKVQVVKIVCANTIEEKVIKLQRIKESLAKSIVDNDSSLDKLSKDDIRYIFE